ncbi:MAG: peptidoglycan-binding protein [Planctomycetes bacterium]|nr:peptidoglycan-binding protein [Planctomycetota bacterium]
MPDHQVKQGDTLVSIAHEHGWRDWETIWLHEANAQLRERRADPQVLEPGDVVHVPDKTPKQVEVAAGRRHRFVAKVLTARFEAVVRDASGNLLKNRRFRVEIEGRAHTGYTDDDARIELDVPPDAKTGVLKVWLGGSGEPVLTWHLQLGHLDPPDTDAGLKARLANLGFYEGALDGPLDDEVKGALRNFQVVYGLEVTGEPDQATRDKLSEIHDASPGSPTA